MISLDRFIKKKVIFQIKYGLIRAICHLIRTKYHIIRAESGMFIDRTELAGTHLIRTDYQPKSDHLVQSSPKVI